MKTLPEHLAKLATLNSLRAIAAYADTMPEEMLRDERWGKATKKRLDEIKAARK